MSPTLEKAGWRLSRREFRFEFPMKENEIFIHIQARKYPHPGFFTISPRSVPRLFHSGSGLIPLQNYSKEEMGDFRIDAEVHLKNVWVRTQGFGLSDLFIVGGKIFVSGIREVVVADAEE